MPSYQRDGNRARRAESTAPGLLRSTLPASGGGGQAEGRKTRRATCVMSSLWATEMDAINLGRGHPNPRLLPLDAIRVAFDEAVQRPNAAVAMMQYGRMQGNQDVCEEICRWITRNAIRSRNVTPANILVTTGSGPGLSLVCQLFSEPGDIILVDSPAYFLAFYAFADSKLQVVEFSTDKDGLDVDAIETYLRTPGAQPPALVYTVPVANNPTGVTMSEERKRRLVELAREFKFKIISDEVYLLLTFPGDRERPSSLAEYDEPQDPVVFALHSFSKLLGPGLRLGWIEADARYVQRMITGGVINSGGGMNPFTSEIVLSMMKSGELDSQIAKVRRMYRENCDVLINSIESELVPALGVGETIRYFHPQGGFFLFIWLPSRFDADSLVRQATSNFGVSCFSGTHFSGDSTRYSHCIRLCFAYLNADTISEGVKRLGRAIRAYEAS